MKDFKSILNDQYQVNYVYSEKIYSSIIDKDGILKPIEPTLGKNIICPSCESNEGIHFKDSQGNTWICKNCIYLGCDRSMKRCRKKIIPFEKIWERMVYEDGERCSLNDLYNRDYISKYKAFAKDPSGFMIFGGETGRGKTYTACAILNERFKYEIDGLFIFFPDMYQKWKLEDERGRIHFLKSLCEYKLLIIDEMNRKPSEAFFDFIFSIIDKRYSSKLGTIITTNLTQDEMSKSYGSAFVSRISSGFKLRFKGPDYRSTPFKRSVLN